MKIANWKLFLLFAFLVPCSLSLSPDFAQAAMVINSPSISNKLTSGLVGWWTFDGGDMTSTVVLDKSGNGGTGTLTGTQRIVGKIGQGINLRGNASGDSVSLTDSASLLALADNSYTVSTWFKFVPGNYNTLIRRDNNGNQGAENRKFISLDNQNGNFLTFQLYNGGVASLAMNDSTHPITDNKWHLATVVVASSTASHVANIYVDGKLNISSSFTTGPSNTAREPWKIGRISNAATLYWVGGVDDTRFYNRALSANEVYSLYRMGGAVAEVNSSQARKLSALDKDTNLVGWWTMDAKDVSGTTVYDRNPNATKNNGTKTGAVPALGKISQSHRFDGINDLISLATPPTLGASDYTVSAWIRSASTADQSIWNVNMTTSDNEWTMEIDGRCTGPAGVICFVTASNPPSTDYKMVTGATNVGDNRWHHVTIVKSGTNGYIYVDGRLDAGPTEVWDISDAASPNYATIGRQRYADGSEGSGSRWTFGGSIDDVRLYSRALSADEVRTLYNQAGKEKLTQAANIGRDKLTNGLVGYWTFDGQDMYGTSALDKSGNANVGTVALVKKTFGKIGQALSFNGISSTLKAGTSATLDPTTTGLTLSAWVYDSGNSSSATVVGRWDSVFGVNDRAYLLYTNGAPFAFSMSTNGDYLGGTMTTLTDPNSHTLNKWYHLVGTWDGPAAGKQTMRLYRDGVQIASGSLTQLNSALNNQVSIGNTAGRVGDAPNGYFKGKIDDVRIYSRALPANEVYSLYQYGK